MTRQSPTRVQGHRARKRFGQHFLTDRHIIERIAGLVVPASEYQVIEIGPGLAALTENLLEHLAHVSVIEIDRDLAARLRKNFDPARLTVIEADALQIDWLKLAGDGKLRLIGNLPYNVATPLMTGLIPVRHCVVDAHFMIQREVADRLVATEGAAYGRLSVLMQAFFEIEPVLTVGPEAFDPPPRVESAVVGLRPHAQARIVDQAILEALLQIAFAQRRKMMRKTLIPWLESKGLDAHGVDPIARAQDIAPQGYHDLANRLAALQTG